MEPSDQKEPIPSENSKRGKLVGKLLVGLFTLSATVIAMIASYSDESGKADSPQAINRFDKALANYIEQGSRSDVEPLGGLKADNSWRIEIAESTFVVHKSKRQTRDEMEKDVDARSATLEKEREVLEKTANVLRSYKNQSIAKGKIFTSVALYNKQTAQKRLTSAVGQAKSREEILAKVRENYNEYNDMDDNTLGDALAFKFPEYKEALLIGRNTNEFGDPILPSKVIEHRGKKDIFDEIATEYSKETADYTKNAATPWNMQSNLALYGKVAAWTLGIGLVAYIAVRFFVFVIVLIWWFMIDRIKDISKAMRG